ncbi:helix-turn-helix domain-containing protein [Gordonibacter pamelaeae]
MDAKRRIERLGSAIRAERERQNLSQSKLALMVEIDQSYLSKVELGQIDIKFSRLCEIAEALDVEVGDLSDR